MVNGDDAGAHADSDRCILSASGDGILKSASVLANGAAAKDFVAQAADRGLGLGLHFNITEGFPTGGPYKTLTDGSQRFISPKNKVWALLSRGEMDPSEIAAEALAQWEALSILADKYGGQLDHLDSHNHVHIYACVLNGLRSGLGRKKGIHVRVPYEPECKPKYLPAFCRPYLSEHEMRRRINRTGWKMSHRFIGFCFAHDPAWSAMRHLEVHPPEEPTAPESDPAKSQTEWMVHVGVRPGSAFTMDSRRNREYRFLRRQTTRDLLAARGFKTGRFGDFA